MNPRSDTAAEVGAPAVGLPRGLRAFGFSIWAGGLVGVLAYLMRFPFVSDIPVAGGVPLSFVFGVFVGLLCSPLVVLALRTRDVTAAKPFVLWSTAVVVCGAAWIVPRERIDVLMELGGGVFVLCALIARLIFPRVWDKVGLCRFCGYDIRASMEFGRCPECGHRFDETPWFARRAVGAPARPARVGAAAWMLRFPSALLLILVLARLASVISADALRQSRCNDILPAVELAAIGLEPVDARACTSFAWDTLYVFGPYTSAEEIEKTLGFSSGIAERAAPGMSDYANVLIFVRGQSVVAYWEIPRRWDFDKSVLGRPIARDDAVFVPQAKDRGTYVLQLRDGAGE